MKSSILKNFIVFEGLDGCGKSSQVRLLKEHLERKGKKVEVSCEPTDGPIGKMVRDVLQHKVITTPKALALLYASDREDHLFHEDVGIKDKTANGYIEISDRYFYSSYAYQSVNVDSNYVKEINNFPSPEFLIYIDVPVDVCLSRIDKRGGEKELFEKKEFLEKVDLNFKSAIKNVNPETKVLVVNGEQDISKIAKEIAFFVDKNIGWENSALTNKHCVPIAKEMIFFFYCMVICI